MTCHDNGDGGILFWPQARLYDAGGSFQMFVANLSSTHRMVSQQDQKVGESKRVGQGKGTIGRRLMKRNGY